MDTASGWKLVVLFLALGLYAVLAAPRGWRDAHITYYGSTNGAGTQGGVPARTRTRTRSATGP